MSKKYEKITDDRALEPSDFYRELAEYDLLDGFVRERMADKVAENPKFEEKVINTLVSHSTEEVEDLDYALLRKFSHSLEIFLTRVNKCRDQKQ
ncbi:MAG: hypothetical protein PHV24_04255 [Candidatus Kapabacteria bacterium]|nr:hypothetical protein [Candidatus Kapabacteria bacterium]